jgi:hypothetical protein
MDPRNSSLSWSSHPGATMHTARTVPPRNGINGLPIGDLHCLLHLYWAPSKRGSATSEIRPSPYGSDKKSEGTHSGSLWLGHVKGWGCLNSTSAAILFRWGGMWMFGKSFGTKQIVVAPGRQPSPREICCSLLGAHCGHPKSLGPLFATSSATAHFSRGQH